MLSLSATWVTCLVPRCTAAEPNMSSTLVLECDLDNVRVVLSGLVVLDKEDKEEEDAVIECSDGRRFPVVKAALTACSGFFR